MYPHNIYSIKKSLCKERIRNGLFWFKWFWNFCVLPLVLLSGLHSISIERATSLNCFVNWLWSWWCEMTMVRSDSLVRAKCLDGKLALMRTSGNNCMSYKLLIKLIVLKFNMMQKWVLKTCVEQWVYIFFFNFWETRSCMTRPLWHDGQTWTLETMLVLRCWPSGKLALFKSSPGTQTVNNLRIAYANLSYLMHIFKMFLFKSQAKEAKSASTEGIINAFYSTVCGNASGVLTFVNSNQTVYILF